MSEQEWEPKSPSFKSFQRKKRKGGDLCTSGLVLLEDQEPQWNIMTGSGPSQLIASQQQETSHPVFNTYSLPWRVIGPLPTSYREWPTPRSGWFTQRCGGHHVPRPRALLLQTKGWLAVLMVLDETGPGQRRRLRPGEQLRGSSRGESPSPRWARGQCLKGDPRNCFPLKSQLPPSNGHQATTVC